MSLLDRLSGRQSPNELLQQIRQDPAGMLRQKGLNIPQGMNNPQQIVQHLVASGQIPNARLQQVLQMMGKR